MHRPIFRVIVMEAFCGLTLAGCAIGENPASPQGVVAEAPYYSQADEDIYLARYRGLIGLVPVLRRSPNSLCHLGFEREGADAAQI